MQNCFAQHESSRHKWAHNSLLLLVLPRLVVLWLRFHSGRSLLRFVTEGQAYTIMIGMHLSLTSCVYFGNVMDTKFVLPMVRCKGLG